MATRTICDRCGRETGTDRVRVQKQLVFDVWIPVCSIAYDLCPDCMRALVRWLSGDMDEGDE